MHELKIKRIYEKPSFDDGKRILVDRLWPRGVSKTQAHLDDWYKDIAPSPHLREWFNHEADKFKEFSIHYKEELKGNDFVQKIKQLLKKEFNRIKKKYPDKVEKIKEHLDQIHYLEKSHCLDLDEVAGHFGHIMASICVYQEDVFKDDLYQMGFYLVLFI